MREFIGWRLCRVVWALVVLDSGHCSWLLRDIGRGGRRCWRLGLFYCLGIGQFYAESGLECGRCRLLLGGDEVLVCGSGAFWVDAGRDERKASSGTRAREGPSCRWLSLIFVVDYGLVFWGGAAGWLRG